MIIPGGLQPRVPQGGQRRLRLALPGPDRGWGQPPQGRGRLEALYEPIIEQSFPVSLI
jgi:hypothetical protein